MSTRDYQARGGICCVLEPLEPRLLLSGDTLALCEDVAAGGLADPPPGYAYTAPEEPVNAKAQKVLWDVPEYFWHHGCGPTAAAMVLGYWDVVAYPNYYPGDASTQTTAVNERIASKGDGSDTTADPGTPGTGHVPDYAFYDGVNDYGWDHALMDLSQIYPPQPHMDDCIADFMGTSRSVYDLTHGSTRGTSIEYGFDNYSTYVGYSCANAKYRAFDDGLTFSMVQGEIDNGRPMVFLVDTGGNGETNHFVPVIGYRTSPRNQYACYTEWSGDPGIHWFDWRGLAEGNTWGVHSATLFSPCIAAPDLAGTHTNVVQEPLQWGDSFSYTYSVKNFGKNAGYGGDEANAGPFTIRFVMSIDDNINSPPDHYLGEVNVGGLVGGGTASGSTTLTLPSSPPPFFTESDEVWIGMIVDFGDAVDEAVEHNNSNLGEYKDYDSVPIDGRADLLGADFEVDVNILNFGEADVSFTVWNVGAAASAACNVGFYLSENSTISLLDDLLGQQDIPALNPSHLYSGTINLTVPTTDPFGGDGTYYVGMIVDRFDAVNEADETNNASRGLGLDYDAGNYGRNIFFTDFDHGDGGMEIDNEPGWAENPGLWHRTNHRSSPGGTYSMYFGQEGIWDYDVGDTAGVFLTKTIELPDEPVAFSMQYWAQTDYNTSTDVFKVEVYDVADDTYHVLLTKTDGSLHNTRGGWASATADLSDYADRRIRLRFAFDTRDDQENAFEGVYFDEITVLAANNPITIEAFRNLKYDSDLYYDALMHWAGDHDTLVFNEEQFGGMFTIHTYDHGSGVNGAVALYDYQTGEMLAIDDNSSGLGDNGRVIFVNSGGWNSYIVEVWDTEEDSMGNLDVLINGNDMISPSDIPLDPNGDGSLTGQYINVDTDTDFYRATAPATANGMLDISVQIKDGTLIPRLQVWKDDGDDAAEAVSISGSAHITGVAAGDVFDISISDNDFDGTGHFDILVSFSTAVPSEMTTADGFAYFHWDGVSRDTQTFSTFFDDAYIASGTDVDSFYFAGDVGWSGEYTVRVNALSGTVDPVVAVYGADTGILLGFDDDSGGGTSAELTLPLTSFVRYIVAVADDNSFDTGDVEIIITAPQGTFGTSIPLDVHGDGQVSDEITTRDTDFFRFYSPPDTNGQLEVIVDPAARALDAAVALFDAAGNQIAISYLESNGANETISVIGLSPSTSYYLTVLAKDYATTGAYDVYVDFGIDSTPVNADAWYSTAEHLHGVGEVLLEIPDDGAFSEPRMAGVTRLVIEFSEPIDPASFTPASVRMAGNDVDSNPVDLSDITVSTSTAVGETVGIIGFTPALPDAVKYIVQIEGVTDVAGNPLVRGNNRIFTALAGDAMEDLRVTAIDLSYLWANRAFTIDGVTESQTRSDVTCDGRVNAIDLSAAWARRGANMQNVPDPVLPPAARGSRKACDAEAVAAAVWGEGDRVDALEGGDPNPGRALRVRASGSRTGPGLGGSWGKRAALGWRRRAEVREALGASGMRRDDGTSASGLETLPVVGVGEELLGRRLDVLALPELSVLKGL